MKDKYLACSFLALALMTLTISGCASPAFVEANSLRSYKSHPTQKYSDMLDFTAKLSEVYLNASDGNSVGRDIFAMGVIGAASAASAAFLFDTHVDAVKGIALGVGTLAGVQNYFKPGDGAQHYLTAAEQLICIEKAGRIIEPIVEKGDKVSENVLKEDGTPKTETKEVNGVDTKFNVKNEYYIASDEERKLLNIMYSAVQSVRIILREKLSRSVPTYSSILNQIKATQQQIVEAGSEERTFNGIIYTKIKKEKLFERFVQDIARCLEIS